MNKKLSVSLMAVAMIATAGVAKPVFASNDSVSVSASADVRMGDDWKNVRDDWQNDRKDMRNEMNDKREDMQKEGRGWMTLWRGKSADVRADIKAGWRNLIEARWRFVGNGFMNIMTRIDSRIDKMEDAGKDVSEAKTRLAEARASFDAARAKAAALADDKNEGMTAEEKMKARAAIETDLQAAKEHLKLSAQALVDAQ